MKLLPGSCNADQTEAKEQQGNRFNSGGGRLGCDLQGSSGLSVSFRQEHTFCSFLISAMINIQYF